MDFGVIDAHKIASIADVPVSKIISFAVPRVTPDVHVILKINNFSLFVAKPPANFSTIHDEAWS